MSKPFVIAKTVILTLIFIFALYFENAAYNRTIIIIGLFIVYLIWQFSINRLRSRKPYSFVVDGLIIFLLEYYSRYLINYSFHFFYIVIIVDIGISLERRRDINAVSVFITITSLSKYVYAMYMIPSGKSIAELFFNLFAQLFIITLINYSKLQKEGKQENEKLYRDLLLAHDKLKDYNETLEIKSALIERTRIAGELHDSLGHNLTTIIMQLEMIDFLNSRGKNIEDTLGEVKVNARDALTKVREVVSTLQEDRDKVMEDIQGLISRFAKDTNVSVNYSLPNVEVPPKQVNVLYRVLQESLTNALRHGKCTEINIKGHIEGGNIHFEFEDNGIGSFGKNGFGQKNMMKRIEDIGGKIEIFPGRPYRVKGSLPLRREGND